MSTSPGTGRRVLVTGASGCIGRQALPLLVQRGWEVHAVSSRSQEVGGPVAWHRADLLVRETAGELVRTVRPGALLHLAWYVAPGQWAAAVENVKWVQASLALAEAFAGAGGRRLVVAGSGLEYDWSYGFCSEERTPCAPHTLYGTSKHALRLLLEGYARQAGFSMAWGRVFFVFGPGEHPDRLVPAVMRAVLDGQRARCSHGRQVRDYLYSGDVADALVTLLESPFEGPVNVASGEAITLRELASQAADLCGGRDRVDFGAIPQAATDTPLVVADVSRLRNDLGWQPRRTLGEGLKETADWWRSRRSAGGGE